MKMSFREGIYATLMKKIIFMRVCFKLLQKTVPLTQYLFSGSVTWCHSEPFDGANK
jgi:hypothetical protein